MLMNNYLIVRFILLAGILGGPTLVAAEAQTWDEKIVQFGKMREAIGAEQHQGRVQLKELRKQPHFYGVAALAGLEGEATILDGEVTITRVDADRQLQPSETDELDEAATLLVGAYVPSWSEYKVQESVKPDEFDHYIADQASKAGLNVSEPFVFTVQGEFRNVRLHVINGACPMHARLKKVKLPKAKQPYEAEMGTVRGRIVGVFAEDEVGNITHPATNTHVHLVYEDPTTGKSVTGHVEQIGLLEGAVLRLPKTK
jgi:alpha-acetolactate decarboxylase